MFKKWIAAIIIVFPLLVVANPLPDNVIPVITEVQWTDSLVWSIELRSFGLLPNNVSLPCTTDTVKLYLFSSKTLYSTRLHFNTEGLAILNRTSITGIPEAQKIEIKRNDTIFIPYVNGKYPPYTYTDEYVDLGWICDIGNLKTSGNSLIGIGWQQFIESSRSSIGTDGVYYTLNHLFLLDRNGCTVSGVSVNSKKVHKNLIHSELYCPYVDQNKSDSDGQITISTMISGYGTAYLYQNDVNYQYNSSYFEKNNLLDSIFPSWYYSYREESIDYYDTLIIAPNFYKVTVFDNKGASYDSLTPKIGEIPVGKSIGNGEYLIRLFRGSSFQIEFYCNNDSTLVAACSLTYIDTPDTLTRTVTVFPTPIIRTTEKSVSGTESRAVFSAFGNLSSGIRFVLSTKLPVNHASISVCSLDGRKVATIQVPLGEPGTHSVHWNSKDASGKKLSPGNYLCNLQLGQKIIASKKVSIF